MIMRPEIKSFFANSANLFLLAISILISILSLSFLASQGPIFSSFKNSLPREAFYVAYLFTAILAVGFILFDKSKKTWTSLLGKIILIYLPSEIFFIYGLQKLTAISSYVGPVSALFTSALAILIIRHSLRNEPPKELQKEEKGSSLEKYAAISIVILAMGLNFFFGYHNLGKMSVVDEPLWTFDRIPNFWRDVDERDWRNTNVSDKPGLTVAAISGIGLFSEPYPKQYKKIYWDEQNFNLNASEMEPFNIAYRLPMLVFSVLILPLFYFLVLRLAGRKSALFSVIFIALAPLLIGNSRIINPDSILWIFTSFSILFYLIHLKEKSRIPLYWSALFLGLAVLTKYTANILYLFFLGLIFAEYIFRPGRYSTQTVREYLKTGFLNFSILVSLSFLTIYFFYPAIWGKPSRFLLMTVHSQPFEPIWPIFSAILAFIALDFFLLKSFVVKNIIGYLSGFSAIIRKAISIIFILSIAGVMLNVYSGMKFFDFEAILASPKSSFGGSDLLGFFLTNFYPLVFGVSALAILVLIVFLSASLRKNKFSENNVVAVQYLLLFIIVYYIGSVASEVASIIRYQIIVFPILLIASGIALGEIFKNLLPEENASSKKLFYVLAFSLIALSSFSLYRIRPFYMGYGSILLPEKYYLDVKDMGEGSYEAAEYLNSLPDAGNLDVWTDKRGVCVFFVGKCHSSLKSDLLSSGDIDYFVISSGRESRTVKMTGRLKIGNKTFQDLYSTENFTRKIEIAGRPNNFVKIISPENIQ